MSKKPGNQVLVSQAIRCEEVTPERWADLERLFGESGACGGCWCMYWRLPRPEFAAGKEGGNHEGLRTLVASGQPPGLLAYDGDTPLGWCAVAPREVFSTLARSKNLAPVDALPVWSLVCLFVARPARRQGISEQLIRGAIDFARRRGAVALEAYPVVPQEAAMPDAFAWTGIFSSFLALGFHEVARRSVNRPIVRLMLGPAVM